jgi:hypothetical protein
LEIIGSASGNEIHDRDVTLMKAKISPADGLATSKVTTPCEAPPKKIMA